eukprot:Nitzschia sp. Nitz4//scaffold74_size92883//61003//61062//NITZ4_004828-RA/size92883-exonerate_protein2genome-gene-0.41-mRNA-1//1//CDS//3329557610//8904//frame0
MQAAMLRRLLLGLVQRLLW